MSFSIWMDALLLRGHAQMTSAERGEGVTQIQRKEGRLRGFGTDKGGGEGIKILKI